MQQRHPPAALQGLLGAPAPVRGYRYVILNLWFITITRRSISLGIATASLSFVALQASESQATWLLHGLSLSLTALHDPRWLIIPFSLTAAGQCSLVLMVGWSAECKLVLDMHSC